MSVLSQHTESWVLLRKSAVIVVMTTTKAACLMVQKCGVANNSKGLIVFLSEDRIFLSLGNESPVFMFKLAFLLNAITTTAVDACHDSARTCRREASFRFQSGLKSKDESQGAEYTLPESCELQFGQSWLMLSSDEEPGRWKKTPKKPRKSTARCRNALMIFKIVYKKPWNPNLGLAMCMVTHLVCAFGQAKGQNYCRHLFPVRANICSFVLGWQWQNHRSLASTLVTENEWHLQTFSRIPSKKTVFWAFTRGRQECRMRLRGIHMPSSDLVGDITSRPLWV